ncbi:alanine dehydrogenase [Syntrophotalea carbinolica DSM 2380]|uniref:Alanine dehydrogenase n=1 Tax=Syntrophotalea carbinolica (strain DSM 2380 / NBRC 103641 / GraBd1) TaxID=338963 RepID=Q3A7G8_SYNC1|nr:alanine dehydrogenase [Syntrophotalea carbinolica]ABA87676.2 alanine dehydrogenase [Syntrophotalea carbinolica DSM 2380]
MIIGVPKEIKTREYRVAMTPAGVRALTEDGHTVLVEREAGIGSGLSDEQYRQAGARLVDAPDSVYAEAELVVKVKEPLPAEYDLLHANQQLFTFLHLAAAPDLTVSLLNNRVTAIAYETIQLADGSLPLLQPMSEVAGRMAVQIGAHFLQKECGGKGVLLAGAPGVRPGRVVVLGAGTGGSNAVRIAVGMGADVTVFDIEPTRLAALDDHYGNHIHTLMSNTQNIEEEVSRADLVVGAVLIPGARAPHLVSEEMVKRMEPGSVIVDLAVDQGGCIETVRPTTHDDPIHERFGILHYGVANMPGAVSRTSTFALTNSTLVYIRKIANQGLQSAMSEDPSLAKGLNTHQGRLHNRAVAEALELPFTPLPF